MSSGTRSAAGASSQMPSRRTRTRSVRRCFSSARAALARLSWKTPRPYVQQQQRGDHQCFEMLTDRELQGDGRLQHPRDGRPEMTCQPLQRVNLLFIHSVSAELGSPQHQTPADDCFAIPCDKTGQFLPPRTLSGDDQGHAPDRRRFQLDAESLGLVGGRFALSPCGDSGRSERDVTLRRGAAANLKFGEPPQSDAT